MTNSERNELDLKWCAAAAASAVDELLVAGLLPADQAEWARQIIAQDLHIQLVSGRRPPDAGK